MEKKFNTEGTRHIYTKLVVALVVLGFIAGGFLLYEVWPLLSEKEIVLATMPVDPFDLIRGNYLTIRYEISEVPYLVGSGFGDSVYIVLKDDKEGIARYSSASLTRPSSGEFILGEIKDVREEKMNVEYGIEQYFIERDSRLNEGIVTVRAKISDSGRAKISSLLVDGKPAEFIYSK